MFITVNIHIMLNFILWNNGFKKFSFFLINLFNVRRTA